MSVVSGNVEGMRCCLLPAAAFHISIIHKLRIRRMLITHTPPPFNFAFVSVCAWTQIGCVCACV